MLRQEAGKDAGTPIATKTHEIMTRFVTRNTCKNSLLYHRLAEPLSDTCLCTFRGTVNLTFPKTVTVTRQ
jgi:hypothetical protein